MDDCLWRGFMCLCQLSLCLVLVRVTSVRPTLARVCAPTQILCGAWRWRFRFRFRRDCPHPCAWYLCRRLPLDARLRRSVFVCPRPSPLTACCSASSYSDFPVHRACALSLNRVLCEMTDKIRQAPWHGAASGRLTSENLQHRDLCQLPSTL